MSKEVKPGYYRHFKGGVYIVLGTVTCAKTSATEVLYRNLAGRFFRRCQDEFTEEVEVPYIKGCEILQPVKRFTRMSREEILALY